MNEQEQLPELLEKAKKQAFNLYKNKQKSSAKLILEQILKISTDLKVIKLLGIIHYEEKEYEKSIDYFKKAIDLEPKDSENYNNLALNYQKTGNFQDAIQNFNTAIKINPSSYFHNNLGYVKENWVI